MGKTVRWFRKLLGGKTVVEPNSKPAKEKTGWRFLRSLHNRRKLVADDGNEEKSVGRKHAIAPPEAEAAAAIAGGRGRTVPAYCSGKREDAAAVKIQAAFRCHLARRALRALKGLVKLQALVRGYIVRKQMLETLHCMHALVRAQARALAGRTHCLHNQHLNKKDPQHLYGPAPTALTGNASKFDSTDTYELERMREVRNLLDPWVDEWSLSHTKHRNTNLQSSQSNVHGFSTLPGSPSKDSTTAQASILSLSSVEMLCKSDRSAYETADNSPEFFSASSKPGSGNRGHFTPSKSDRSWSFLSMYSNYPNYMAETESSRAKVRSQSAPKQRPELENCSSAKRFSVRGCEDVFLAKFRSKGYPGSGQLDRLGMPIDYNVINRRNMH